MEAILAVVLFLLLVYLVFGLLVEPNELLPVSRKRLCDYSVQGTVFEDLSKALKRGLRLAEAHVYSDEQGHAVVAKKPLKGGYDYAEDNVSFEEYCVTLVNEAFPSDDPFILSIFPHTTNTTTLDEVAYHLTTILRRHLTPEKDGVALMSLDSLANKLIVTSGGNIAGTKLEELVNLSVRRLGYSQATDVRDPKELVAYNKNAITLVAPDPAFTKSTVNPKVVRAYGCQWILFPDASAAAGFVEKPRGLQ
jgi:hypothetical protein